jgi:protein-tyrosine phosphatase
MQYTRHLPLKQIYNARDLGGYATADGGCTRFGVFLRSDAPCEVGEADIAALLSYGVTGTMDLRSDGERKARPSAMKERAIYYEESLFAESAIYGAAPPPQQGATWLEKYIDMAESAPKWAVRTLTIGANHAGCLLYHCTTGKDRTGLLTCYLLSIAGVSREDIAADYCVSELYLQPVYQRMRAGKIPLGPPPGGKPGGSPADDEGFFHTPASAMLGFQDYMGKTYGGVVEFLRKAGLSEEVIHTLRAKLVNY